MTENKTDWLDEILDRFSEEIDQAEIHFHYDLTGKSFAESYKESKEQAKSQILAEVRRMALECLAQTLNPNGIFQILMKVPIDKETHITVGDMGRIERATEQSINTAFGGKEKSNE